MLSPSFSHSRSLHEHELYKYLIWLDLDPLRRSVKRSQPKNIPSAPQVHRIITAEQRIQTVFYEYIYSQHALAGAINLFPNSPRALSLYPRRRRRLGDRNSFPSRPAPPPPCPSSAPCSCNAPSPPPLPPRFLTLRILLEFQWNSAFPVALWRLRPPCRAESQTIEFSKGEKFVSDCLTKVEWQRILSICSR